MVGVMGPIEYWEDRIEENWQATFLVADLWHALFLSCGARLSRWDFKSFAIALLTSSNSARSAFSSVASDSKSIQSSSDSTGLVSLGNLAMTADSSAVSSASIRANASSNKAGYQKTGLRIRAVGAMRIVCDHRDWVPSSTRSATAGCELSLRTPPRHQTASKEILKAGQPFIRANLCANTA